jgi:regulatory protein
VGAERDPLEIAARALRHRDRSRREIETRLARAGVGEDERTDALDTLERVGYVDDERFAAARAEALAGRGFGDEAIRHDLGEQGVTPEAADTAIDSLVPEVERARAIVGRLGRSRKTAAQLARKGFAEESLESAVGAELQDLDA